MVLKQGQSTSNAIVKFTYPFRFAVCLLALDNVYFPVNLCLCDWYMELLVLTVPALLGGDVSDAGCLVIFWEMACVVVFCTLQLHLYVHFCQTGQLHCIVAGSHCSWKCYFLAHQHDHPFWCAVGQHELSYQDLISIFHMGRKKK